jgi:hypothetical protein
MMTLVLTALGTSTPTELLPGTGARMWMRSALSAAAMLLESAEIFSSFTPGRGMQFVAGDGRPLGDVAERNLDVELRQRLLHEPRVGHQFLLGFGRLDGHCRVQEKSSEGNW